MKLEQKARELRERKKGNITATSAKKHPKKLNKKVYRRSSELLHGISRPTRVVAMTCQKISGLSRKGEREKKRLSPDALRCQFATLGARERGNWLVHIFFFFFYVCLVYLYIYLPLVSMTSLRVATDMRLLGICIAFSAPDLL